jgi:hypothetical protein
MNVIHHSRELRRFVTILELIDQEIIGISTGSHFRCTAVYALFESLGLSSKL